ncbi:MAG TPA: tetratricopeptide repeat protein [Phycisphaerae bacterium]|nr:tetratricopeptide repeat protein [Phycisphaerae bacterium]
MAATKHGCVIAAMMCLAGCGMTQEMVTTPQDASWTKVSAEARARAQPAPEPTLLPVTYFSAGRLFERRGELHQAAEQYRKAVALNADFLQAYNRLGAVLTRMGRWEEADRVFVSAIHRAPNTAYLRNNLAFSYMAQSRWQDAEAELRNAIQLKPSFARARVNLGVVLAKQGDAEGAFAQFSQVMSLAEAHFNMGVLHRGDHRLDQAREAFAQALALRPNWAKVRTQLQQTEALIAASQGPKAKTVAEATVVDEHVEPTVEPTPGPAAEVEPAVAAEPLPAPEEPAEQAAEAEPIASAKDTQPAEAAALPVAERIDEMSVRPATCKEVAEPVRPSLAPQALRTDRPAEQQEAPQLMWFESAEASVWTQDAFVEPKAATPEPAPVDQPVPTAIERTTEELPEAEPVQIPDELSVGEAPQDLRVVERRPVYEPFARRARQIVEYSGWPNVLREAGQIDLGRLESWLAPQRWLDAGMVLRPLDASAGKLVWERSVPADG